MAIQLSESVRNARLDAIEATISTAPTLHIFATSIPANCAAADNGTPLVSISLPSDWLNAAASGQKTLLGVWSGTATAGGTAAHFRLKQGATCHMQGTCGQGSGDLSLNNTNIAVDQTVTVTGFTLTDGNS